MLETLMNVALAGMQIWLRREDNYPLHLKEEITNEFLKLRREWNEEYEKPRHKRNNDTLTRLEFQLRDVADKFALTVRSSSLAGEP